MKWALKAAKQGIPNAHFKLAQMYRKGFGVHKSPETAADWYLKTAESGDAGARDTAFR